MSQVIIGIAERILDLEIGCNRIYVGIHSEQLQGFFVMSFGRHECISEDTCSKIQQDEHKTLVISEVMDKNFGAIRNVSNQGKP